MNASVQPYGKLGREITNSLKPMARALLTTITANINLHTNKLECSLSALANLAMMSKDSVIKYTRLLELAGHIKVKRKPGGKHDEVNVYSLAGNHAQIALFSDVETSDSTSRQNRQHQSAKSTAEVDNSDTDYIDSNDSKSEEEDLNALPEEKPKSDSGEYDLPGEGEDPTLPEQDAQMSRIEALGITGAAREAAELYPERIDAAIKLAKKKGDIRDLPGYISKLLINGIYADVNQTDEVPETKPKKQNQFANMTWADLSSDLGASTAHSSAETSLQGALDDKDWKTAYNQIELQLDKNSFDLFLKDARHIGYEDGGNTYLIQVKTEYARDMLQHRLYRNVRRVLMDVRNQQTELRFVVASEVNREQV